ncbi:MAG: alpha/beta hydrolase fold domain-containing protein [Opitutaceae bacterium]|nr:alpha/beta hydrolase fold domain-containing protein [Opitutaceae bacterium]
MLVRRLLPGLVLALVAVSPAARAQTGAEVDAAAADAAAHIKPDRLVTYKTVGTVTLQISVFNPPGHTAAKPVAGIVFFHGGGFNVGAPSNFYAQARYLADRGMVALSVEYRIRTRHQTTQREAVQDAMSALRWVRRHTAELGLDPRRIAVAGGSAGGFLAAAVTTLRGLDEPGEDTSVSTRPNALILYNAMIDRGPGSRAFAKTKAALGDQWKTVSPLHNLYPDFPPTIHFLGTADKNITVESARKMKAEIERVGGRCDLHLYEGQEHGFFNYGRDDNRYFTLTLIETDRFLVSLGYLSGTPTLTAPPPRR